MGTTTDYLRTELSLDGAQQYVADLDKLSRAQKEAANAEASANRVREQTQRHLQASMGFYQQQIQMHQRYAMTAGAVATAAIGVGVAFGNMASRAEQAKIGLKTLLGQQAGEDMFKQLREFARQTPFEFKDLPPLAQRFTAMGVPAKELISSMRAIGDTVAAMGGGADLMDRIVLAMGQMRNSARLNAQDMNQLSQAGVNGWKMVGDAIGKTAGEARKLNESGGISGLQAFNAIIGGMQGSYGGAMANQMQTAAGKASQLKDAISDLAMAFGAELLPQFKDAVDGATAVVGAFAAMPDGARKATVTGAEIGVVTVAVFALTHALQAQALQYTVNRMQSEMMTLQLEREGIAASSLTGKYAMRSAIMGGVGAGMVGGAAGYMLGGYSANMSTGAGMATWAGAALTGAGAGAVVGGPVGAVVGALTGLAGAAASATIELNKIQADSNAGARGMENKFPTTFIPGDQITAQQAAQIGGAWAGSHLGKQGYFAPTENVQMGRARAETLGLTKTSHGLGFGDTWADAMRTVGVVGPGNERAWQTWLAGTSSVGEMSASEAPTAAGVGADQQKARIDAQKQTIELQSALTGEWEAYIQKLGAAKAPLYEIEAAKNNLNAVYQGEIKALYELADAQEQAGETTNAATLRTRALSLETAMATDATKAQADATKAWEDRVRGVGAALQGLQGGAGSYIQLLEQMGVGASSPYMRQARQYQSNIGWAEAQYGMATGDTQGYYAGLSQYVTGQQGLAGAAGKKGARIPGLGAGDVLAPWQMPNAQQQMAMAVNVWVQMPNGQYIPALVRSMQTTGGIAQLGQALDREAAYGTG